MSTLTMYPVQSMRKFVCDRLTAAAQEILGAFEKRVEDYEAELARQRRMLDTVFSPEMKLQRGELKALQNQHQLGYNYGMSRFPPDTVHIKDEHEEISISQERPQPPLQQEAPASTLTPASGLNTSGAQTQPLGPEKESVANKDPLSNSSNEDVESQSKEGRSPVSEQPLSQNSGEGETQNDDRGALPADPNKATLSERSRALATSSEDAFDDAFLNANYEDILNEIDDNTFVLSTMSPEPSFNMSFDDLNETSASLTEPAQLEKDHVESPMLMGSTGLTQNISTGFTKPTASNESAQARICAGDDKTPTPEGKQTQTEESQDWRPEYSILTVPTPANENQDQRPATTERVEDQNERRAFCTSNQNDKGTTSAESAQLTPNEKSQDGGVRSTENAEQTSEKQNYDTTTSSTKSVEQTSSQGSIKESMASVDGKKKHQDERMPLHKSTDPSLEKKSQDSSETRLHEKNRQESARSNVDPTLSSVHCGDAHSAFNPMQSPRLDGKKTACNESTDQDANLKHDEEISNRSSNSQQNYEHGDNKPASTQNTEIVRSDNSEKTETVPSKKSSDGKKTASHSKSKDKSSDWSSMSGRSIEPTAAGKFHNDDANGKKATSTRRLRESQGPESLQKRLCKEEGFTSTRSSQTKKQDENSKASTASNQSPDPPVSNTDDTESSDGEEKVENPYKCDRCGKVMSNFKNYKFHMKSHTVAKTYKCETCGKMFRESWDLNKHLVIHSAEKPYKCDVCGNGFNRRYNLDLHVRVHTGEKPYICNTCGKSFSSCVNMKKHMRIHTGEKPYTCKDCGKEFADSSAFKNHLRVHTGEKPFKCSYCKRKFATRTTLKRHIRTHTGEKPYKCTFCDRKFGHRTDLKGHVRMHTGEKPYKCTTCGEDFSTWSKLNKHKRTHSGEAQDSTE